MLSNITFKHRIIGAIFLVSIAVILIPAFFDSPSVDTLAGKKSLPEAPQLAQGDDFTKIEYTFTELLTDPEEASQPATLLVEETVIETPATDPLATEEVAALEETMVMQDVISEEVLTQETPTTEVLAQETIATPIPAETPQQAIIATTEKLITDTAWAVQLGAFTKAENAENLLNRLKQEGYIAYTEHMPQTQLTRVLVGAEPNRKQAAELLTQLDETMHLKGIIVKLSP